MSGDDRRARLWLFLRWGPTLGEALVSLHPACFCLILRLVYWLIEFYIANRSHALSSPSPCPLPRGGEGRVRGHAYAINRSIAYTKLNSKPCWPFLQQSDPKRPIERALRLLGGGMFGRNLLEHPIIECCAFPLACGPS
jgi:hypothetical protein